MSVRLPRLIVWLARSLAPPQRAAMVLADLQDDYESGRGGRHPRVWLLREASSLSLAYGAARLKRMVDRLPLLKRDGQLALRSLRRSPLAAVATAAMLSVGVVAVLLVGAIADALLFRYVSATEGDALRRIVAIDRQGRTASRFSYLELRQIRGGVGDAGEVGAVYLQPFVLRTANADLQTMAEIVASRSFRCSRRRHSPPWLGFPVWWQWPCPVVRRSTHQRRQRRSSRPETR